MGLQLTCNFFNPDIEIGINFKVFGYLDKNHAWFIILLSFGDITLFTFLRIFADTLSSPLALFGSKLLMIINTSVTVTPNLKKNYY